MSSIKISSCVDNLIHQSAARWLIEVALKSKQLRDIAIAFVQTGSLVKPYGRLM